MKLEIHANFFQHDGSTLDVIEIDGVPHVFGHAVGDAVGITGGGEAFAAHVPFIRTASFGEGSGFCRIDDRMHEALGDAWQVIGMYSVGDVLLTLPGLRALDRLQPTLRLGAFITAFAAACGAEPDDDEEE